MRATATNAIYNWDKNFTFVDIPGPAGTYTYQVTVTENFRANIVSIFVHIIGLTATVYPPA
ncbi:MULTISPECIES: hypothetical protein [Bacillus cereus group]|uniref:hypothetical protein n=1 Tax=Bacillus cereus group TaxID=86661 RepID=UPI0011A4FE01|nr:hypothetical protein [Bacillus mycoides]